MIWLSEIDLAQPVEDLRTSGSTLGNNLPNLGLRRSRIHGRNYWGANDFRKYSLKNKVRRMKTDFFEEENSLHDRSTIISGSLAQPILFWISLILYNVQRFDTKRDEILHLMKKIPEDCVNFFKMRLRDSEQLTSTVALYTQDTLQKGEEPSWMTDQPQEPQPASGTTKTRKERERE